MYPEYLSGQVKQVEKTRPKRVDLALSGKPVYPPMNAEEREDVLSKYHPDLRREPSAPSASARTGARS